MKNLLIIGLIVAIGYYFMGTSSECTTPGDVSDKRAELIRKFQSASSTLSPQKVQAISQKIKILEARNSSGKSKSFKPQEFCDLIDEFIAEL